MTSIARGKIVGTLIKALEVVTLIYKGWLEWFQELEQEMEIEWESRASRVWVRFASGYEKRVARVQWESRAPYSIGADSWKKKYTRELIPEKLQTKLKKTF